MSHVQRGAERAGRQLEDLYILVLTALHFTKPGETLANVQQAVGPLVVSECNIFAFSVTDPYQLPGDIRDDLMAFKYAYRTPNAPLETRHLDLYTLCYLFIVSRPLGFFTRIALKERDLD